MGLRATQIQYRVFDPGAAHMNVVYGISACSGAEATLSVMDPNGGELAQRLARPPVLHPQQPAPAARRAARALTG